MRILILIFSFIILTSCNFSNEGIKESIIVDVRTSEEWEQNGHAVCAINFPSDQFESKINIL